MNVDWQIMRLGDLCDVLDYKRQPITRRDRVSGDYPYYGATGILDHVEGFLFDEPLVLVGEDGAKWESGENTAFAVDGKCWVNNHAHVLRPNRSLVVDGWLIDFLNHSDLTKYVSGLTVPKLNQGSLREIPIPVPPLPEQKRIVAILDEAFEGIATAKANAERNLRNARNLFDGHLQAVFTTRGMASVGKVPLSTLLAAQPRNGWSPPAEYQTGTGFPVLTLSAVTGFEYDGSRVKMSSVPTRADAHYWLRDGELLITRSNTQDLVGHVAIYDGNPRQAICCDLIMKMMVNPSKAVTRFVYYYLRTPAARTYLMEHAQGASSTMKKIGKHVVQDIGIPLVSLCDQQAIVSSIDALSAETTRLAALYQRKLDALDDLKKSLLDQAFRGELSNRSEGPTPDSSIPRAKAQRRQGEAGNG